jgi:hypothetical protein
MPAADLTKSDMRGDMSRWCARHHRRICSVSIHRFFFFSNNQRFSIFKYFYFFSFRSQDRALFAPQHPLLPPHPVTRHASSTHPSIPQLPPTPFPIYTASPRSQEQREAGAVSAPDAGLQQVIATMPDTIVKVPKWLLLAWLLRNHGFVFWG